MKDKLENAAEELKDKLTGGQAEETKDKGRQEVGEAKQTDDELDANAGQGSEATDAGHVRARSTELVEDAEQGSETTDVGEGHVRPRSTE